MDNNLSGGYITNDNTLSGIIDITADSIIATTITAENGYFTNLTYENLDGPFIGEAKWGSFYSLATQTNPTANTTNIMSFSNYDPSNNGVQFVPTYSNRIKVDMSGVYNIQFSAQVNLTQGSSADIYIWLRKNGANLPDSTGKEHLTHDNGQIIAWNYIITLNANDYIELVWSSSNTHVQLLYQAASGSPTKPAVPSIILTVSSVSTNIKGDQGDEGPQGEQGNIGPTGSTGPTGPTGPQGPQGIQGNAAVIQVGTTTTLPAGSSNSVSNVGTSSNAIFNFALAEGAQGPQGPQGPEGPRGNAAHSTIEAIAAAAAASASAASAATSAGSAWAAADFAATAGAEAGEAAAEAVVEDLEQRVQIVEAKTQFQTAYTDIGGDKHTEFDGLVEIMNNDGFLRITLDATSNGRIVVGAASANPKTTIDPGYIATSSITTTTIDSIDSFTNLNIGPTAPQVIIGNTISVQGTQLTTSSALSTSFINPLAVQSQSMNAGYFDSINLGDTLDIGQSASTINIGNPFTAAVGIPTINLYGKVNFDPTEIVGVVYQFLT